MNKEQFIETLFNVVDKKIAKTLAEEAESKGYFETSEYNSRRLISEKNLRKAVKLLSKFFENHERVECFHYMNDCRLSDFVVKALSLDK